MASVKKRLDCFQNALCGFWKSQQDYLATRKQGKRPRKEKNVQSK